VICAIVTDIEGTTSSIEFVHAILFPYARRELGAFVRGHAGEERVRIELAAVDQLVGRALTLDEQVATLEQWSDEDRKATPLKSLQGMIWRTGYERGALEGHVYPEVAACLRRWHAAGTRLYVYSSGSEQAQRLLFAHSVAGDLSPLFAGYFDTRVGAKADPAAYERIRAAIHEPAAGIAFLSDVGSELDAARTAGMQTCQLVRTADCPLAPTHPHARDFAEVDTQLFAATIKPAVVVTRDS
jgi:enolase-phosphatase E1